jgi:DNA processing protein
MGIDAAAHDEAIAVGGRTVAFLGCGADRVHPPSNRRLMGELIKRGAVFSEYLPGTPPLPQNFPQRNRLISGSALGVVVVEAGERSGALITAGFAAEQGRDVYAVPGNITSAMSRGSNALLRDGAGVVTCVEDIVFSLGPYLSEGCESLAASRAESAARQSREGSLGIGEKAVVGFVRERGAANIDEIVEGARIGVGAACAALVVLETEGLVRRLPNDTYEYISF